MCVHVCMYTYVYVCVHVCMCTCVCMYVYMCVRVCMCPHICFYVQIFFFFFYNWISSLVEMELHLCFLLVVLGDKDFSHRNQNPPSPVLLPCDSKKMFHQRTAHRARSAITGDQRQLCCSLVCHGVSSENSTHSGWASLSSLFSHLFWTGELSNSRQSRS
jgi:hypothetical protein